MWSCHVMPCPMSCHAMPCHAMPCDGPGGTGSDGIGRDGTFGVVWYVHIASRHIGPGDRATGEEVRCAHPDHVSPRLCAGASRTSTLILGQYVAASRRPNGRTHRAASSPTSPGPDIRCSVAEAGNFISGGAAQGPECAPAHRVPADHRPGPQSSTERRSTDRGGRGFQTTPSPRPSDWAKFPDGPSANQQFSLGPSAPVSLGQTKSFFGPLPSITLGPVEWVVVVGGGVPPPPPL